MQRLLNNASGVSPFTLWKEVTLKKYNNRNCRLKVKGKEKIDKEELKNRKRKIFISASKKGFFKNGHWQNLKKIIISSIIELISEISKVGYLYKINTQKSLAFLHTNNEKSEREIKESIPFAIATKRN